MSRWQLFGFILIVMGLIVVGLVLLIVGVLVTSAITLIAAGHVYRQLDGTLQIPETATTDEARMAWRRCAPNA